METQQDLEVKTSPSSDSKVIHIHESGFGIFAIECNILICALVSSPLLSLAQWMYIAGIKPDIRRIGHAPDFPPPLVISAIGA